MKIQNHNIYTPNFKAKFSNDTETKQILKNAMQDGKDATHTIYSTLIMLDNLESDDVLSMKKVGTLYQIKNQNTQKCTYIVPDRLEKNQYLTDYSESSNLATAIHNAIFGENINTIKLFGKVPEDKNNYIKYHQKCFERMEKSTDNKDFKELKEALRLEIDKLKGEIQSKQEKIQKKENKIQELQKKQDNKEQEYILSLIV